jgi:hypothetical protein
MVCNSPTTLPTIQVATKHVENLLIPWLDVGSNPTDSTFALRSLSVGGLFFS